MKRLHPQPIDIRPGQRSPWYAELRFARKHPEAVITALYFATGVRPKLNLGSWALDQEAAS